MANLRIAGPTPYYPGVYDALKKEMISHRSHDYQTLHKNVIDMARPFFGLNDGSLYVLTSSGTGGMEAGISNFFNPGDKVIAFSVGIFGDRWIKIAKAYQLNVIEIRSPMGEPVDLQSAIISLQKHPDAKGVHITHNETSTAVLNDVKGIAALAQKYIPTALILVDSISVLSASEMEMDQWGIDYVVTSSQKAWSAPSGLCLVGLSARAHDRMQTIETSRYYFDFRLIDKYAQKNETPTTPAVPALFGMEAALRTMQKEGKEAIYKRHRDLRDKLRGGVKKLGLELLVRDECASPTITAIFEPQKSQAKEWLSILKTKYDVIVSGGKGDLQGKIIRIAHMGYVTEKDIDHTLVSLESSLSDLKNQ